jgi:hypothetical protein
MRRRERLELKFYLHHSVKALLFERWRPHLVRAPFTDRHARTPVLSQYYDSPDLRFYREKLDGVGFRNKVRLRVYDLAFRPGAAAFLEIKHRDYDRLRKVRQVLREFHPRQLDPAHWRFDSPELEAPFRSLLERFRLRPSAQVYYQREAYQAAADADVRVTFDTNLLALHPGERVTSELLRSRSRRLMPDTGVIAELKVTHRIPDWFHEGVVGVELEQRTLSKYVTAVELLDLPALHTGEVWA